MLQRLGQGEVFNGIDLLMNRDGAAVELLGLGEFAQVDRDPGQVVQRQCDLVMLRTKPESKREYSFEVGCGLLVVVPFAGDLGKEQQILKDRLGLGSLVGLPNVQRPFRELFRVGVVLRATSTRARS